MRGTVCPGSGDGAKVLTQNDFNGGAGNYSHSWQLRLRNGMEGLI